MEDIDFLLRLRRKGRQALINLPVTTSARRFLKRGLIRQQMLNICLVALYLLGLRPETLSTWYSSGGAKMTRPRQLERHNVGFADRSSRQRQPRR